MVAWATEGAVSVPRAIVSMRFLTTLLPATVDIRTRPSEVGSPWAGAPWRPWQSGLQVGARAVRRLGCGVGAAVTRERGRAGPADPCTTALGRTISAKFHLPVEHTRGGTAPCLSAASLPPCHTRGAVPFLSATAPLIAACTLHGAMPHIALRTNIGLDDISMNV